MGIFEESNKKAVLLWLDQAAGKLFLEWVTEQLKHSSHSLERSSETPELFRSQGDVRTWKRIINLKNELLVGVPKSGNKEGQNA